MNRRNFFIVYSIFGILFTLFSIIIYRVLPFWYFCVAIISLVFSKMFVDDFIGAFFEEKKIKKLKKKRKLRGIKKKLIFSIFLFLLSIESLFIKYKYKFLFTFGFLYFSLFSLFLLKKELNKI